MNVEDRTDIAEKLYAGAFVNLLPFGAENDGGTPRTVGPYGTSRLSND